jgi:hypothetical protein
MIDLRLATTALIFLAGTSIAAQGGLQYREYRLESSLATVLAVSPTRMNQPRTVHERPASVQEVRWRAPYMGLGDGRADPVNEVLFTFYNDHLYQIVVTYDRGRMAGLTSDDVVDTLSAAYGIPLLRDTRRSPTANHVDVRADMLIVAEWEDPGSRLTLLGSSPAHSPQFQLVLVSKRLNPPARAAILEARRLDALEAPQRELERRAQAAAAATQVEEKTRETNKAAFRP